MLQTRTSTTLQGDESSLSRSQPTSGSASYAVSPVPSDAPGCDHSYHDTEFSHLLVADSHSSSSLSGSVPQSPSSPLRVLTGPPAVQLQPAHHSAAAALTTAPPAHPSQQGFPFRISGPSPPPPAQLPAMVSPPLLPREQSRTSAQASQLPQLGQLPPQGRRDILQPELAPNRSQLQEQPELLFQPPPLLSSHTRPSLSRLQPADHGAALVPHFDAPRLPSRQCWRLQVRPARPHPRLLLGTPVVAAGSVWVVDGLDDEPPSPDAWTAYLRPSGFSHASASDRTPTVQQSESGPGQCPNLLTVPLSQLPELARPLSTALAANVQRALSVSDSLLIRWEPYPEPRESELSSAMSGRLGPVGSALAMDSSWMDELLAAVLACRNRSGGHFQVGPRRAYAALHAAVTRRSGWPETLVTLDLDLGSCYYWHAPHGPPAQAQGAPSPAISSTGMRTLPVVFPIGIPLLECAPQPWPGLLDTPSVKCCYLSPADPASQAGIANLLQDIALPQSPAMGDPGLSRCTAAAQSPPADTTHALQAPTHLLPGPRTLDEYGVHLATAALRPEQSRTVSSMACDAIPGYCWGFALLCGDSTSR